MSERPAGVLIRRAGPVEDLLLEAVSRLVVDVYGGEGHVSGPYLDVLGRARDRAGAADVLVALDDVDGELLGTVTFAVAPSPYSNIADAGDAEFRMLAVAPTARRRGIARALVIACIERGRRAGARRLWLSSGRSMTAAHALYASMGFVRTPDRDWEPEPGDRLLTFALDLVPDAGPGPAAGHVQPSGDEAGLA